MVQQRQPPAAPPPAQPQRPTFKGQQPGEVVDFVIGPHPLWYLVSSWKLVLLLCVLLGVYFVGELLSFEGVPGWILWGIVGGLFLLHLSRWISEDLNEWIRRRYILTDWRVVDQRGFFYIKREQAHIDRIQQLQIIRANALSSWLDIGDVKITTAGDRSDLTFEGVHHPRQVALAIQLAQINRGDKHFAKPVVPRNPAVRTVMERFEERDYPPLTPPTPERNARRHVPIQLLPNEFVVECIRRHWFNFLMRAWAAFATALGGILLGGLLGAAGGAEVGASPFVLALLGLVIGGVWALGVYLNYADDYLILTTHRVIDLDRYFYVFAESAAEATYRKIQDVQIDIPPLGQMLGFGSIFIETAGRAKNLEMKYMPHVRIIQDHIFRRIDYAETRSERTARSIRRMEFRRWMGTLLNDLLIDVPDVHGLPLLEAAGRAHAAGLRLIVSEERYEPDEPPGRVLEQTPRERTTAVLGSEVSVVLSSHA